MHSVGALDASAELATQLSRSDEAKAFQEEAAFVRNQLIKEVLWSEEKQAFKNSETSETRALHAQTLALCSILVMQKNYLKLLSLGIVLISNKVSNKVKTVDTSNSIFTFTCYQNLQSLENETSWVVY